VEANDIDGDVFADWAMSKNSLDASTALAMLQGWEMACGN
jgi:hypothetical protein